MPRALLLFSAILLACSYLGCGKSNGPGAESSNHLTVRNLVLEREIAGSIDGLRLGRPSGLSVDRRGFLYVADQANNRVIRFQPDLVVDQFIGGLGRATGLFDHPGALDVDRSYNTWICDVNNDRLVRLNLEFRSTLEIELSDLTDPLKYGEASGVAVGDNGEVWMTDRERNRIAIFDLTGLFLRFAGDIDAGRGLLSGPTGIAYRGREGFVVCDTDNGRLVYFDHNGNYLFHLSLDVITAPTAIAIDSLGNAWVLDRDAGTLAYVEQSGVKAGVSGTVLLGLRQPLGHPSDIAVLGPNLLAVADTDNDRIAILRTIVEPAAPGVSPSN